MGNGIDDHLKGGKTIESDFKSVEIDSEKKRLPQIIRDKILKKERLISVNESFYHLQRNVLGGGRWVKLDDRRVLIAIERVCGKNYTRKIAGETVDLLHNSCYRNHEELNSNKNEINVLNGVLDIRELKLREFKDDDMFSYQIPISYDKEALCPGWDQTLKSIFNGYEENIRLIQQIAGYCLQTAHNNEKFFVFYGNGANGKGVVTHVFESILGKDNCVSLGLEKLGDSKWAEALVDKMLNLATESDSRAGRWSETMKVAVSGEAIMVNPKYKPIFKFYPFAKHIITMNDRPYIEDKSDGVMRRMIVVPFENTFSENERDIGLKSRLIRCESAGILNWFLAGLQMYLDRGFDVPKYNLDVAREIKIESNSVMMFVEECCELISGAEISTNEFYSRYYDWCRDSGCRSFSKSRVSRILKIDYNVENFSTTRNGIKSRFYTGIVTT